MRFYFYNHYYLFTDAIEKEEWLKTNCDPADEVQHAWEKTLAIRNKRLKEDKCTVDEYFSRYPSLKTQLAVNLVSLSLSYSLCTVFFKL